MRDFHRSVRVENGGDKVKEKDRGNQSTSNRSDRFKETQGSQFHTYTPLNAVRGKIMDETLQGELLLTLKQL